jgi:hypothetical protein
MLKRLFTIGLFFSFSCVLCAQTNTFPSSGNVGIGILNPTAMLHIKSTYGNADLILESLNGIKWDLTSNNNDGIFSIYQPSTSRVRFAINSNGNVGIGTSNPGFPLEVLGKIRASTLPGASGQFEASNATNGNIYFQTNTSSGNGIVYLNNVGGTNTIVLQTNGSSYFNGGNVLIGKTTQINTTYKLDVNGSVRANKIIVNTTGADFVFEPSYKLMPLKDLSLYLQRNHHLPDIKSANEMEKNGINLGENQTILLQKTEELTLYIIEQNKKLSQQQSTIELLQAQLEKQKADLDELKKKIK